jgi:hypothetical protein
MLDAVISQASSSRPCKIQNGERRLLLGYHLINVIFARSRSLHKINTLLSRTALSILVRGDCCLSLDPRSELREQYSNADKGFSELCCYLFHSFDFIRILNRPSRSILRLLEGRPKVALGVRHNRSRLSWTRLAPAAR